MKLVQFMTKAAEPIKNHPYGGQLYSSFLDNSALHGTEKLTYNAAFVTLEHSYVLGGKRLVEVFPVVASNYIDLKVLDTSH